jgi:hypothetical protein
MLKQSDLMALCRFVAIEAGSNRYANIVEPSTGFTGEIVTTGYLNDLLIRNGSCFNTKESIQAVVDQINNYSGTHAALRVNLYDSASGVLANVYGIEFDNSTVLWLTRYAVAPSSVVDLSNQAKVATTTEASDPTGGFSTPASLRAAVTTKLEETTNSTEATEVEDPTWFEKIGELNGDHKAWLLVQLNAAFTRIGRKDLFAEFVEAIDPK